MWRGLMLNRGVTHFLQDVAWGDDLDYLFIDMPPGHRRRADGRGQAAAARRGDRGHHAGPRRAEGGQPGGVDGPQELPAGGRRDREHEQPSPASTARRYTLFGEGGGAELAADAGVPLLGQIPLEPAVSAGGDDGEPVVLGEGPAADAFRAIADHILTEAIPPGRDGRLQRPHARSRGRGARRAERAHVGDQRRPATCPAPCRRALSLQQVRPHGALGHRDELVDQVGVERGHDLLRPSWCRTARTSRTCARACGGGRGTRRSWRWAAR